MISRFIDVRTTKIGTDIANRLFEESDLEVSKKEFKVWEEEASKELDLNESDFYRVFLPFLIEQDLDFKLEEVLSPSFATFYEYTCKMIVKLGDSRFAGWSPDDALVNLGAQYYKGAIGATGEDPDYLTAFNYYQEAADMGNIQALVNLGYCYQFGHGCERNYDNAFKCFSTAHLMNFENPEAVYKLGDMYFYGNGVPLNKELAFNLYIEAHDLIDEDFYLDPYYDLLPSIIKRLIKCYHHGLGVYRDYKQALRLCHQLEFVMYQLEETTYEMDESLYYWLLDEMRELREQLRFGFLDRDDFADDYDECLDCDSDDDDQEVQAMIDKINQRRSSLFPEIQ